eukprot:3245758-Rhodomonas_salina.4
MGEVDTTYLRKYRTSAVTFLLGLVSSIVHLPRHQTTQRNRAGIRRGDRTLHLRQYPRDLLLQSGWVSLSQYRTSHSTRVGRYLGSCSASGSSGAKRRHTAAFLVAAYARLVPRPEVQYREPVQPTLVLYCES